MRPGRFIHYFAIKFCTKRDVASQFPSLLRSLRGVNFKVLWGKPVETLYRNPPTDSISWCRFANLEQNQ